MYIRALRKIPIVSTYSYTTSQMLKDYSRVGTGMALTAIPLFLPNLSTVLEILFSAVFLLFGYYGIATIRRHTSRIHVTEQYLSLQGLGVTSINWRDIKSLKLAYYSTMQGGGKGWMQLSVLGGFQRITIDSRLDGFPKIVQLAANGARVNGLALDLITIDNLVALGIPTSVIGEGVPT